MRLDGRSSFNTLSGVFTQVEIGQQDGRRGEGNAGDIEITTPSLSVNSGAQLSTSTLGIGDAGQIKVQASESVTLANRGEISSSVGQKAEGNSGEIILTTPTLSLTDNAQISAATAGRGDAGSVRIENGDLVTLDNNSTISTVVDSSAVGNGGNLDIQTRSLSLSNNSQITTQTSGQGDAGEVRVLVSLW